MPSNVTEVYAIGFTDTSHEISHRLRAAIPVHVRHVQAIEAADNDLWRNYRGSIAIGAGAAGAYLAHRSAWHRCAEDLDEGAYALVIEDDAILTDYGTKWLAHVVERARAEQWKFVQLGTNRSELITGRRVSPAKLEHIAEMRLLKRAAPQFTQALRSCNYASLIRGDFAAWLAAADLDFAMPVDNWLRALSLDPAHRMMRVRQTMFLTAGRSSDIDARGRT